MRNSKLMVSCGVFAALAFMTSAALAGHGKVGLWSMTVTMSGQSGMPDMSKMPPEVQARMRAMGMSSNGNMMTVQHCMTAAEVSADVPHMDQRSEKSCKLSNMKTTGHMMTGDMVCSGAFTGTGHMQYTFDGDTHYMGEVAMDGTTEGGRPIHNDEKIEGRWISADCRGVTH